MTRAFLSIGSNLGGRIGNCRRALLRLSEFREIIIISKSRFYETAPWGGASGARYINCAAGIKTSLKPAELLGLLKSVEREMGRGKNARFGPRPIDIDILFYGDKIVRGRGLVIPHPSAHERAFVLAPLGEIAPDLIHPVLGKDVRSLLGSVKGKDKVIGLDALTPHSG
ncbi:MAG: 2-amino-4-hydroxy-6-hydroxymethyldihydropteridine diphosphokinase [Deltaproteobacteria bacterium]|nr:2-amino-4-hydroxy-6-hydroxymethyldihydropteridine diphosphokinase [Deltaproteobacteria bacterium]